jgi:hypothetical protein
MIWESPYLVYGLILGAVAWFSAWSLGLIWGAFKELSKG